jgi:hypothetical protein
VAISMVVRQALIQFVGDVAAYVQPHRLDRFHALREKVKETVRGVVAAVYRARRPDGRFEYDRVGLVGHSLGSVVLYDTLNRLINDDALAVGAGREHVSPRDLDVCGRTTLFLTVGSPLDKIAFIFGSQRRQSELRSALEATGQPLIERAACRQFDWVNVYSPWDFISGRLDYYDPPNRTGDDKESHRPVDNVIDPDASTLLLAHVEYWDNRRLYDLLLARIP